jgi:alanine-alpha-ketoisovalerate/valine-pyruvate aminotransferase
MQHIELTDTQIADIREKLRTSGDRHLQPLGNNLTDEQIEKLAYIAQESEDTLTGDAAAAFG